MSGSLARRVTVTVAVPSVGRHDVLGNSLKAIQAQADTPDELMVVAQEWDSTTHAIARAHGARLVLVAQPGLAVAVETGIAAAKTDVISFVDDDAEAFPDWVRSIRLAFTEDPTLGLLGGRDNVAGDPTVGRPDLIVGRLIRGKIYGNHHIGMGAARAADHVKGANMSLRVNPARRVPLGALVAGEGAQARNEFVLSLAIRSQGYSGRYDPDVQVNHFPATRAAGDERTKYSRHRSKLLRHNETVAIALFRPFPDLVAYVVRSLVVGDRIYFGGVHFALKALRREPGAFDRFVGAASGIASGLRAARRLRSQKLTSGD